MLAGLSPKLKPHSPLLRRLSIKNRLLIAFLITSLLPVLLVAVYSNLRYEASISNKLSASFLQILSESAVNASRELAQYETLSESIIIHPLIQSGLRRYDEMTDYESNELQTEIKDDLGEQVFRLSNLSNVVILTNEGETFFDLGFEWYPNNQLADSLSGVEASSGNAKWTYLRSNRDSDKIALGRIIYSEDNLNRQLGYLIIVIDEKVFSRNTYEHVSLGSGSRLYIADKNGTVVSSGTSSISRGSTYMQQEVFDVIGQHPPNTSFYTRIDGRKTLVTSFYMRSADWYMIGLVPHASIISELSEMRGNLLYISFLILLLSAFVALWIYRSISHPMRDLLQYAAQIKIGQLDARLGSTNPDEMGKLAETIDQMVERLKQLIYQVEVEQKEKRDAELNMLQAQINPHFLFNTLNSLKWSAMMSGNQAVEQGIASLSELLRNTILDQEEIIPLRKEIENVLHYSVIQRIRYGDSFHLYCRLGDERLNDCLVPRFILQPIVENSILHAGGEEGRVVNIRIEATREEGETLRLAIIDDGKGFDMNERPRRYSHDKLSGIGMANVEERIRLHVGPGYGMETRSRLSVGTETVIRLPIRIKEDEGGGSEHV
ncbi:sensor histidine kinase [Cohnella thailandensis]|uniref:Histidine kinase n=1 Tax=Cohnella thailandensis TaxID=557557 RepID=A0A841T5H4_9BACL|nr:sensor histidine kinase [Cohnella thailandensis]MBB6637117.1 histidine kinase [Cohnella thailandensis]MBP1977065.1 two-component system sensor histidine kinase YesM [Cohnella thailandensis]